MADVRKVVTVVFTDVAGSTRLGEQLDPETARLVMSRYFDAMQSAVEAHGGTVEKFIGDAVMAVFGLPTLHEDDALRAVRAAVEMRESLTTLNDELRRDYGLKLEARTGVNTGEVIAGDTASEQKLATGDAVNVAARLEQAAAAGEILIGEATYRLLDGTVHAEPIRPLELKGKAEPVPAWRVARLQAPESTSAHVTFVGRSRELDLLRESFATATRELTCVLATVVASPGMGKSTLARELASGLDARIAVGRCLAYGESITYAPLAEIARQLDEPEPEVAPFIAAALGTSEEQVTPEQIAWGFRKLFEASARERPLVLVVDDIHWAEPTLLDLLEYVAGFASGAPILLLCLARPDLFDNRPSWSTPRANATVVSLQPLTSGETERLVAELGDVTEDVRTRIVTAAEGNPLFVEHILALQAEAPQAELVVPPTIQALLAARIDRLEADEREILTRASIEGRVFHRAAATALLPDERRSNAGAALLSLVRKELLRPDRALLPGDDGFRFSHVLIRDAAYNYLPKQLRGELHERYARWLQVRVSPDYLEVIAYHLEQAWRYRTELRTAGDDDQALAQEAGKLLWSAARAASVRMDLPAAVSLYDRAVALLPHEPTGDLLQELGAALNRNGEDDRARTTLGRAINVARRAGNRRTELFAHLDTYWIPPPSGGQRRNSDVRSELEALIPELESLGDDLGLTKVWQLMATTNYMTGQNAQSVTDLGRALRHARVLGDRVEESEIWALMVGAYYAGSVPADECLARCQLLLDEHQGDWMIEAAVLARTSGLRAMRGDFAQAREAALRSIALCSEFNIEYGHPWFEYRDIEMLAGNYEAAETWLRSGKDNPWAQQRWWGLGFLLDASIAAALCAQERYEDAERITAVIPDDVGDFVQGHVQWRAARARALAHLGRLEEALTLADVAVLLAAETDALNLHAEALLSRADVFDASGDDSRGARDLADALALFERKGNLVMANRLVNA